VVATFSVGAVRVGEALFVPSCFYFRNHFRAEVLRLGVLRGGELREREIGAEGVRFDIGGDFPEFRDMRVGEVERFEAERFRVGKFEHAFFAAANGDDGLGGGIIDRILFFVFFSGVDYAVDVLFGVGAEFKFFGDLLHGGGGHGAFDGADGDVARASGGERRDADFADEDCVALRAKLQDVIDPGGTVTESSLGDDVEGFEIGDDVGDGFWNGEG